MKKFRHTPGPWHTDPEFDNRVVLGADGAMVADCNIFGLAVIEKRTTAICHANARLIAAAPEMHEVLQEMVRAFGAHVIHASMYRAKELLAKVEGGNL